MNLDYFIDKSIEQLNRTFLKYYNTPKPISFNENSRIFEDLHTDKPRGKGQALEWIYEACRKLKVNPIIPDLRKKDYTIREIATCMAKDLSKRVA